MLFVQGKAKTDKNRMRVEEAFLKSTHVARAEAAAQRKEDRRRAEKERILQEEDPDKQRKWEEKEQKRLAKKRTPRMKQLRIKALWPDNWESFDETLIFVFVWFIDVETRRWSSRIHDEFNYRCEYIASRWTVLCSVYRIESRILVNKFNLKLEWSNSIGFSYPVWKKCVSRLLWVSFATRLIVGVNDF